MVIVHTIAELRQALAAYSRPAFVPTMGNLHNGHLALVRQAQALGDVSVASIFVNRLQFLPHEDFDRYPRTWERDCEALRAVGCGVLFAPSEAELYPQPQTFKVLPDPALADVLEGAFRPGFFTGVCTVVMKLLACVQPRVAVFGRKDLQQLRVVQRMVQQFALPVEIVAGATERSPEGLALSSRNAYLSEEQQQEALRLSATLQAVAQAIRSEGLASIKPLRLRALEQQAMADLSQAGWQPDYIAVRRLEDLSEPAEPTATAAKSHEPLVVLGAARLGSVRLIDNLDV